MVAKRRTSPPPVELVRNSTASLDGHRINLRPGVEASIRVPGRKTKLRAKFLYADDNGGLTFKDPRNGGLRTVTADAVCEVHYKRKLEEKPR